MRSSVTIAALLPIVLGACTAPIPAPADPRGTDRAAFGTYLGGAFDAAVARLPALTPPAETP